MNLIEGLNQELKQAKELLIVYESIPSGGFGASMIRQAIDGENLSGWSNRMQPKQFHTTIIEGELPATPKRPPKTGVCPHCKFLHNTFLKSPDATNKDYYLMTEVFVYLHGGDECKYSNRVVNVINNE